MSDTGFRPKYITFDCYGTLTNFQMKEAALDYFSDKVDPAVMPEFIRNFNSYRMDEIMGAWKPYVEVITNGIERTCAAHGIACGPEIGRLIYERVPTWGPHPDVTGGLRRVADKIPLAILSNAMNDQLPQNVEKLGAPFNMALTAQDAGVYKPQFKAFEYMFDMLGCGPEEMMHVSSSFRYDLQAAHDLGFGARVWVNRGNEPANTFYSTVEIADIGALPALVGL